MGRNTDNFQNNHRIFEPPSNRIILIFPEVLLKSYKGKDAVGLTGISLFHRVCCRLVTSQISALVISTL